MDRLICLYQKINNRKLASQWPQNCCIIVSHLWILNLHSLLIQTKFFLQAAYWKSVSTMGLKGLLPHSNSAHTGCTFIKRVGKDKHFWPEDWYSLSSLIIQLKKKRANPKVHYSFCPFSCTLIFFSAHQNESISSLSLKHSPILCWWIFTFFSLWEYIAGK